MFLFPRPTAAAPPTLGGGGGAFSEFLESKVSKSTKMMTDDKLGWEMGKNKKMERTGQI